MPKFKNSYYILRHGETIYQTKNKALTYPWPENSPVKLTKKGEKQIKAAASKLKTETGGKIDAIYASDMFRTRQTAKIVANKFGLEPVFSKMLRDLKPGIYQGRPKEDYYRSFPLGSKKRFFKAPSKGESWLICQKRMLNFLKNIDRAHKGKTILIIGHGDPLWLLEGAVKNFSLGKMLKEKKENYIQVGQFRKLC